LIQKELKQSRKFPYPKPREPSNISLVKINYFRRFVPNLAETIKPILKLLKKYVKFEWTDKGRKVFKSIKDAIARSHVLISHDYSKDFQVSSFASEDTIAGA
jgi:hypothetical protein